MLSFLKFDIQIYLIIEFGDVNNLGDLTVTNEIPKGGSTFLDYFLVK